MLRHHLEKSCVWVLARWIYHNSELGICFFFLNLYPGGGSYLRFFFFEYLPVPKVSRCSGISLDVLRVAQALSNVQLFFFWKHSNSSFDLNHAWLNVCSSVGPTAKTAKKMTERQQLSYALRKSDSMTTASLATAKSGTRLVKRREVFANGTVCSGWWKQSSEDSDVLISEGFGAQVRPNVCSRHQPSTPHFCIFTTPIFLFFCFWAKPCLHAVCIVNI